MRVGFAYNQGSFFPCNPAWHTRFGRGRPHPRCLIPSHPPHRIPTHPSDHDLGSTAWSSLLSHAVLASGASGGRPGSGLAIRSLMHNGAKWTATDDSHDASRAWQPRCNPGSFADPATVGVDGFQLDPFGVVFLNMEGRHEIPPDL